MTDTPQDDLPLHEKAYLALREAARRVHEEARRSGGTVVVWRNSRVEGILADQWPTDLAPLLTTKEGPTE